jgi:hypothetical protein
VSATNRFDIRAAQAGGAGQLLRLAVVAALQSGGQSGDGGGPGGGGGGGLDGGGVPVVDVHATVASAVSFEPSEKVASAWNGQLPPVHPFETNGE